MVAVDLGPGLFTGLRVGVATAKAMAHALRVPMIGVPSLDLLAFPVRFTLPADRGRRRRPPGRAVLRLLPAGARRRAAHRRPPGGHARRPRRRAAGLGRGVPARRRRRHPLPRGVRRAEQGRDRRARSWPTRRPSSLVHAGPRPGPARAVREAVGPAAAVPAQARRRDQLVDPGAAADGCRPTTVADATGPPGAGRRAHRPDAPASPPQRAAHRGPGRAPAAGRSGCS